MVKPGAISPRMTTIRPAGLAVSGAFGILLAGLVYSLAGRGAAALSAFIPPQAEPFIFAFLLLFSLAEIPMMVLGLRTLARQQIHRAVIYSANAGYVAFAAVYSAILIVLCGQSILTALLAGLCAARWISSQWIR